PRGTGPRAGGGPPRRADRRGTAAAGAARLLRHRPLFALPAAGPVSPAEVPGRARPGHSPRRRPHLLRRARGDRRGRGAGPGHGPGRSRGDGRRRGRGHQHPGNDLVAIHTKQAPYLTYVVAGRVPRGAVARALYWDTLDPYHYVRLQPAAPGGTGG